MQGARKKDELWKLNNVCERKIYEYNEYNLQQIENKEFKSLQVFSKNYLLKFRTKKSEVNVFSRNPLIYLLSVLNTYHLVLSYLRKFLKTRADFVL